MIENLKKLFKIKASTRDNVKYIVRNNDDTLINETDSKGNIKTVPKSIAFLSTSSRLGLSKILMLL